MIVCEAVVEKDARRAYGREVGDASAKLGGAIDAEKVSMALAGHFQRDYDGFVADLAADVQSIAVISDGGFAQAVNDGATRRDVADLSAPVRTGPKSAGGGFFSLCLGLGLEFQGPRRFFVVGLENTHLLLAQGKERHGVAIGGAVLEPFLPIGWRLLGQ